MIKSVNSWTQKINRVFFGKFLQLMDHPKRIEKSPPEKIVSQSHIVSGSRVLEVGCGSGFFTPAISHAVGNEGLVISIDSNETAVSVTQRKIVSQNISNVCVQQANCLQTDFANDWFDVICIYGVIPAPFLSTLSIMKEMYRVVRQKGYICVWSGPFSLNTSIIKRLPLHFEGNYDGVYSFKKKLNITLIKNNSSLKGEHNEYNNNMFQSNRKYPVHSIASVQSPY